MNKLITIVGASGVGKTALVRALANSGTFATAYEQPDERPFQALFKADRRYALANQIDFFLLRAAQEKELRAADKTGLIDGGLDLDFHGFTRLFLQRGLLTQLEFDLCLRLYSQLRESLPLPDLIVHLTASEKIITRRLASRRRINIASAQDAEALEGFIREWLNSLPEEKVLRLDASSEDENYPEATRQILAWVASTKQR